MKLDNTYFIIIPVCIVSLLFSFSTVLHSLIENYFGGPRQLAYLPNYCNDHGEYCPFCTTKKCICSDPWYGPTCATATSCSNSTNCFPNTYYDWESARSVYMGQISETACREACYLDTTCKGYMIDPCPIPLLSNCTYPGELNCCNATTYPEAICCSPQCRHIKNYVGYNKPLYVTGYQRVPNNESNIPRSEKILYPRIDKESFGYISTYDKDYGIVYVDEIVKEYSDYHMDLIMTGSLVNISLNTGFYDSLPSKFGYYAQMRNYIGNLLEITDMPFLHMKRFLNYKNTSVGTITVASARGDHFKTISITDYYNYQFLTKELKVEDIDYGEEIIEPHDFYDTILLTVSMYTRSSISKLLTNAYNRLNNGGYLIIVDQIWSEINEYALENWCMGAGMAKDLFMTEYLAQMQSFPRYSASDASKVEPEVIESGQPFPLKSTQCWGWDPLFVHPNHTGKWIYIMAKK